MRPSARPAVLAAGLLIVIGAGAALANRAPDTTEQPATTASSHEPGASAAPQAVSHALERLSESGIAVSESELSELAAAYGVGGAVRLVAWADASGMSVAELRAMRDEGRGWGEIAREHDLHPGIGSIMGRGSSNSAAGGPPGDPPGGPPRSPDD
jgi:hypothetical protein